MKILFSNIYYQQKVEAASLMSIVPPLDIAYCASVLRQSQNKLNINLIDANAQRLKFQKHLDMIINKKPDILVLTAKTYSINSVKRLCKILRKKDNELRLILIGSHGSALPKQTLIEIPELDFIILGEPEYIVRELIENIMSGKNSSKLPAIVYGEGSKIFVNNKVGFIKDLNQLPFPARDLLPNDRYWAPYSDRVTAIQATRGCPGRCNYCEMHNLYGFKIRKRDPNNIVMEIQECIKKYNTEYFAIIDHNFIADKEFIEEFCRIIIKKGLQRKIIWSCNSRVDMVHKETLDIMKKAGCLQIGVGVEAGDDKHLKLTGKGIRQDQIKKTIDNIKRAGIMVMGYAMIGYPGDTIEDIKRTKRLLFDFNPHVIQLSLATPLPGSQLYDYCNKKGLITTKNWDDYIFLNKSIIKNKNLPSRKLIEEKNRIVFRFYFRPIKIIELNYLILFRTRVKYINIVKGFFKILASLIR